VGDVGAQEGADLLLRRSAPGLRRIQVQSSSPMCGSGMPKTWASATAGCW
jgi:hypothetical protein